MLKITYCLVRRPELSREAFQAHWRDRHAPLVAAARQALAIRRYVQSRTISTAIDAPVRAARGMPDGDYDGVAELWWDDEAALVAAISSDEGARHAAILVEDEAKFIDFKRSRIFFSREKIVVG